MVKSKINMNEMPLTVLNQCDNFQPLRVKGKRRPEVKTGFRQWK